DRARRHARLAHGRPHAPPRDRAREGPHRARRGRGDVRPARGWVGRIYCRVRRADARRAGARTAADAKGPVRRGRRGLAMKPGFFVKEALRSIRRNPIPSFAAMASMLVTLLVLGVFIPMVQATTGAANTVRGRVLLDVYMQRDASGSDLARVRARIA